MSRTIRRYINGVGRDGKQDLRTLVARDDRATGLRDHKRDRRVAKTIRYDRKLGFSEAEIEKDLEAFLPD